MLWDTLVMLQRELHMSRREVLRLDLDQIASYAAAMGRIAERERKAAERRRRDVPEEDRLRLDHHQQRAAEIRAREERRRKERGR